MSVLKFPTKSDLKHISILKQEIEALKKYRDFYLAQKVEKKWNWDIGLELATHMMKFESWIFNRKQQIKGIEGKL